MKIYAYKVTSFLFYGHVMELLIEISIIAHQVFEPFSIHNVNFTSHLYLLITTLLKIVI